MHTQNLEIEHVFIDVDEQFVIVDFVDAETGETIQVRRDIAIDAEDSSYDIFEGGRMEINRIIERYTGRAPTLVH